MSLGGSTGMPRRNQPQIPSSVGNNQFARVGGNQFPRPALPTPPGITAGNTSINTESVGNNQFARVGGNQFPRPALPTPKGGLPGNISSLLGSLLTRKIPGGNF